MDPHVKKAAITDGKQSYSIIQPKMTRALSKATSELDKAHTEHTNAGMIKKLFVTKSRLNKAMDHYDDAYHSSLFGEKKAMDPHVKEALSKLFSPKAHKDFKKKQQTDKGMGKVDLVHGGTHPAYGTPANGTSPVTDKEESIIQKGIKAIDKKIHYTPAKEKKAADWGHAPYYATRLAAGFTGAAIGAYRGKKGHKGVAASKGGLIGSLAGIPLGIAAQVANDTIKEAAMDSLLRNAAPILGGAAMGAAISKPGKRLSGASSGAVVGYGAEVAKGLISKQSSDAFQRGFFSAAKAHGLDDKQAQEAWQKMNKQ